MTHKYYQRQISLDEVGVEGQDKLSKSSVLVIGAGGLGSPVLQYLAAAGVGHISIIDHDQVDITNLHRQILFGIADQGMFKALVAKRELNRKNPYIKVEAYCESFDHNTLISGYDLVIDCTDNFKTKFLAHDMCFKHKINYLQASIYKFEGHIQLFHFEKSENNSPCLRCLYPQMPKQVGTQTCEQVGVLGAVPGVIGSLQAVEAIKVLIGLPTINTGEDLLINLMPFSTSKIKWLKDPNCICCSNSNKKRDNTLNLEVSISEQIFEDSLIVVLNNHKFEIPNSIVYSTPQTILEDLKEIPQDQKITIACNRGITSYDCVLNLRENGYSNCYSLKNGTQHYK
jgi:adenylyltransferase/sulfurtransferase